MPSLSALPSFTASTVAWLTLAPCICAATPLASCASAPAEPVAFKPVPEARVVKTGITQPGSGLIAVDVRRERSRDLIVRFRDALVYVDGEQVTDLMNGEDVTFFLSPGAHRIGVSTQFDPVTEMCFTVTAETACLHATANRTTRKPPFNKWIRAIHAEHLT